MISRSAGGRRSWPTIGPRADEVSGAISILEAAADIQLVPAYSALLRTCGGALATRIGSASRMNSWRPRAAPTVDAHTFDARRHGEPG